MNSAKASVARIKWFLCSVASFTSVLNVRKSGINSLFCTRLAKYAGLSPKSLDLFNGKVLTNWPSSKRNKQLSPTIQTSTWFSSSINFNPIKVDVAGSKELKRF